MKQENRIAGEIIKKSITTNDLWASKYFPTCRDEVPLYTNNQKKKLDNVINLCFSRMRDHTRVLVITGPVGCGKTSCLKYFCREKNVEIVEFSPDDDEYFEKSESNEESPLIQKLKIFLDRSQLVTNPSISRIILIDDITLNKNDMQHFLNIIDLYNRSSRLFPLIWIADPNNTRSKIANCFYYNFGPAPRSVLKRVINRVAKAQGINISEQQLNNILEENPGDLRLAINMLQLTRATVITGKYENLSYFQAIGEILYQKNKRSSEDILRISHCSPQMMINGLYENALDFFMDVSDYVHAADSFSVADMFMESGWLAPETLPEVAATTVMRSVLTSNNHRKQNQFHDMRQGSKSRHKIEQRGDLYDLELMLKTMKHSNDEINHSNGDDNNGGSFLCFPSKFGNANPELLDSWLFNQNGYSLSKTAKDEMKAKEREHRFDEQELAEALNLLSLDPIEADDF